MYIIAGSTGTLGTAIVKALSKENELFLIGRDEAKIKEQASSWRKEWCWHPHQLRHNAGTELRREFGIEAARLILGHSSAAITEIYAEIDRDQAKLIAGKVG